MRLLMLALGMVTAMLAVTPASAASICPPGLAIDPLDRCVCPTGRLTEWDLVREGAGAGEACVALPFIDPDTHTRGGTVTIVRLPGGGFVSVPSDNPGNGGPGGPGGGVDPSCPGCGPTPTDGGGGCRAHGGGGGNCGVGLGLGGGNGTGNEGNGNGPKGGPKKPPGGHPTH